MGSGPMNPGMENQAPFPPLDFTIPECSVPKYSPINQQWSNGVTSSSMGRGPMDLGPLDPPSMGPGMMGSGPMNPGMENQVLFPPLDFTIPECSVPKYSPMSQQWSNGVTLSGMGRGLMGPGPLEFDLPECSNPIFSMPQMSQQLSNIVTLPGIGKGPINPGMENQVPIPIEFTVPECSEPIFSMTQMSQQLSNIVTSPGIGEESMGYGPLGAPPMNPGMENQVPFPPLDFTIPECFKPIYSPMSQ